MAHGSSSLTQSGSGLQTRGGEPAGGNALRDGFPGLLAVEKVLRTFSTDENLRFSRTLRVRDRIPAIRQAVFSQPASVLNQKLIPLEVA
jgi:hypothetical protein